MIIITAWRVESVTTSCGRFPFSALERRRAPATVEHFETELCGPVAADDVPRCPVGFTRGFDGVVVERAEQDARDVGSHGVLARRVPFPLETGGVRGALIARSAQSGECLGDDLSGRGPARIP